MSTVSTLSGTTKNNIKTADSFQQCILSKQMFLTVAQNHSIFIFIRTLQKRSNFMAMFGHCHDNVVCCRRHRRL